MKVVVVIPTYNERDNIITLLDALARAFVTVKRHTISYLVVDDTSPDGTLDVVKKYKKDHKNVFVISGKREGLGKALLRGMTEAFEQMGAEAVLQIDADLSHDPSVAPKFLEALDNGATFVVGSRYIPGGAIPSNWGLIRKIYSIVGNTIVRFGLGHVTIRDWTGGYRAYLKKYYIDNKQEMAPYSGYVFQIAFLHKSVHRGAIVREIPFHFTDRLFGHSKIAPGEYIFNIYKYMAISRFLELRHGPFAKFAVVGTAGFIINTTILELMVRAGFHPAVGSAVGAECAIISNFIFNNNWTFRGRKIGGLQAIPKFFQFNATSIGAILIQSGTVALGTFMFGRDSYRWFYLLGVGIGMLWNYTMYSRLIWKK